MSDFWKDYEPEPTRPAPVTKDEVLKLALEALTVLLDEWTPARQAQLKGMEAVTAIKQARALDKKAENARELGLDYEPVWCGHCNGSGRMVRDPDIGTDQECFVCDGAGVPAAPVQPSHETLMAGYKVACAFGVYENQAFNLAEKMFAAMKSAAPESEKKHD